MSIKEQCYSNLYTDYCKLIKGRSQAIGYEEVFKNMIWMSKCDEHIEGLAEMRERLWWINHDFHRDGCHYEKDNITMKPEAKQELQQIVIDELAPFIKPTDITRTWFYTHPNVKVGLLSSMYSGLVYYCFFTPAKRPHKSLACSFVFGMTYLAMKI